MTERDEILRRDVQLLAREAICDARTARKFLEGGGPIVSTMRLRLEEAAAKLKIGKWEPQGGMGNGNESKPGGDAA